MKRSTPETLVHTLDRLPSALLVGLLALLVLAARPAAAAGPVITDEAFGGTVLETYCGAFQVRADFSGERRFIRFYDEAGALLREVRHVSFTGTLTNTTSGAVIPYEGSFTRTFDAEAQTVTITGLRSQTVLPGEGAVEVVAGQLVVDVSNAPSDVEVIAAHGRQDIAAQVCAALA